jgi:UDP-N-acetylmuramate dehydrogenase
MKIQEKILLKDYSTFKIGGPAKHFVEIKKIEDLKKAIQWAKEKRKKFMILGGGSNLLFSDQGFNGLVIKLKNKKLELKKETDIICQSGVALSQLVNFSVEEGLTGLEWAAGIPGTVGGAVRGNAGAFGFEMKDAVEEVVYFNLEKLEQEKCDKNQCKFDYRESVFKEFDHKIIWEIIFNLEKGDKKKIKEKVEEIIEQRNEKHPCLMSNGSAGSIFKNPVVSQDIINNFEKEKGIKCKGEAKQVPAGWLIDMCDLKGMRIGGVKVSEKQANFIVNDQNGTANDVVILISLIKQKVRNTFGVQLEEEIEIVSY